MRRTDVVHASNGRRACVVRASRDGGVRSWTMFLFHPGNSGRARSDQPVNVTVLTSGQAEGPPVPEEFEKVQRNLS